MTAPTTADNVTAVTHCTILGNTANWKRIQGRSNQIWLKFGRERRLKIYFWPRMTSFNHS